MGKLCWLHLSDWQQNLRETGLMFLRDSLISDIEQRKEINKNLSKIDLIIFSGDVTYSGKAEEYLAAKEQLLEPLLDACNLGRDHLFIVPGNHDLDRNKISKLERYIKPKSEFQLSKLLNNDQERKKLLKPFDAFNKFVQMYTGQSDPSYANIKRYNIDGKEIALLGINSALFSGRSESRNSSMLIGEEQIQGLLKEASTADVRIAVLHHPFDCLDEFDRNIVEGRLLSTCNFILCGHQHGSKPKIVRSTFGNCAIISTGGCYIGQLANERCSMSAYNFSHLNYDTKGCNVFLRQWDDINNNWAKDSVLQENGMFDFQLSDLNQVNSPDEIEEDFHPNINHEKLRFFEKDIPWVGDYLKNLQNLGLTLGPEPHIVPKYLLSGSFNNEFEIAVISKRLILSEFHKKIMDINKDKFYKNIDNIIKRNIVSKSKKAAANGAKIIILSGLPYLYLEDNILRNSLKSICKYNNCFIIYNSYYNSVVFDSNVKRTCVFNPILDEPIIQSDFRSNIFEEDSKDLSHIADKSLNIFQTIYGNFMIILGFDIFSTDLMKNLKALNNIPSLFKPVDIIINPNSSTSPEISKFFCKNMSEVLNSYSIFLNDTSFEEGISVFMNGNNVLNEKSLKYKNGYIRFFKVNLAYLNAERCKNARNKHSNSIGDEVYYGQRLH